MGGGNRRPGGLRIDVFRRLRLASRRKGLAPEGVPPASAAAAAACCATRRASSAAAVTTALPALTPACTRDWKSSSCVGRRGTLRAALLPPLAAAPVPCGVTNSFGEGTSAPDDNGEDEGGFEALPGAGGGGGGSRLANGGVLAAA